MLVFRKPTIADASAIAELHAISWQQNYRGAFSDTYLDEEALTDRTVVWADRLLNPTPNQFVRVVADDISIVGFVCAFFNDSIEYGTLLDNLHVSSQMKDKGIGKQLMGLVAKEIIMEYPETGIYLWVLEQNLGARYFYESLGGEKLETVTGHDIGDRPIMKVRYYWPSMKSILNKVNS